MKFLFIYSIFMFLGAFALETSNDALEDCSICFEPIKQVEYFQSFNCTHTQIHQGCAQSWVDMETSSQSCPICRAPTFLIPTPTRIRITDPEILLVRAESMMYAIRINNFGYAMRMLIECEFTTGAILEFILYALRKKSWVILSDLLHLHKNFHFQDLENVYRRVLKLRNSYYEVLMTAILQRTRVNSSSDLIFEHKLCIERKDARCVSVFLNWYHRYRITVPTLTGINPSLEIFISKYPLFMSDSSILVELPRTLISSRTIGLVLIAQLHKMYHSQDYATTFQAVVTKDVIIPNVFMREILHYTIKHGSKMDLELVLSYRHFSMWDIDGEITRLSGKSAMNRLFSLTRRDDWAIEKLASYEPVIE